MTVARDTGMATRQQRRAAEQAARKARRRKGGAIAVGALLAAGSASAATITVNTTSDTVVTNSQCSLREAMQNASDNAATNSDCTGGSGPDTINFSLPNPSTITLGGTELPLIGDSLTINGPGAAALTISGASQSRIFHVDADSPIDVNINNLTVTSGIAPAPADSGDVPVGGGIYDLDQNLTLDHVVVSGSTAAFGGGVAFNVSYGAATLTVTNSTISGNTAYYGGGIAVNGYYAYTGAAVTISDTTISGNTVLLNGGGIQLYGGYGETSLSITSSTITGNTAILGDGGGLEVYQTYASIYLKNDTFSSNQAGSDGGGIEIVLAGCDCTPPFTMKNTIVRDNASGTGLGNPGNGGGLRVEGGVEGTGTAIIEDSVITGNVADPNDAAAAALTGSDSSDRGYGGGLYFTGYVDATVRRTTISGNTAYSGGGVYIWQNADTTFENVTIANNHGISPIDAGLGGGVRLAAQDAVATFNETTIAGNNAETGGGGIDTDPATTATLYNAIVANNSGGAGTNDINSGGIVTATYTLIEDPGSATIGGGTGNLTGDPNLGPLANNGSTVIAGAPASTAVPQTELPLCPSPVINAGDPGFAPPPATDERNFTRVVGGQIDMGAAEVQAGVLQFAVTAANIAENGGSISIAVTRTGEAGGAVSVPVSVAPGGTATGGGVDYTFGGTTLNWASCDSANKTFNIAITDDALFEGNESFTLQFGAPTGGATIGANSTETVTILDNESASADVSITKSVSGSGPFNVGQNITFNIAVTNNGPGSATGVTVTDVLPSNTAFFSATPTQGSCSGTTTVTCNLGTLANAATANIALVVRITSGGAGSNTATVSDATADGAPSNNASTAIFQVIAAGAPTLDGRMQLLLAAMLAAIAAYGVRQR